jgi:hypothetical protein
LNKSEPKSTSDVDLNRLNLEDAKKLLLRNKLPEEQITDRLKKWETLSDLSSNISTISRESSIESVQSNFVRSFRLTQSERYSKFREKVRIRKNDRAKSLVMMDEVERKKLVKFMEEKEKIAAKTNKLIEPLVQKELLINQNQNISKNLQKQPLFTPKDFDLSLNKNNQNLTKIRGTMLINHKKVISLRITVEKNN